MMCAGVHAGAPLVRAVGDTFSGAVFSRASVVLPPSPRQAGNDPDSNAQARGARRHVEGAARRLQLATVAGAGDGEAFGVPMKLKRAVGGNMGICGNTKDEVIH